MAKILYLLLTVLGGAAMGVQSPVNAALGKRIGALEAGLVSFSIGTVLLLVLVLFFGHGQISGAAQAPKWELIGGALGVFLVVTLIITTPKLGVLVALMAALVGQMIVSTIVDHYGLFAVDIAPVNWERLLGLGLLLLGMVFIVKSKLS